MSLFDSGSLTWQSQNSYVNKSQNIKMDKEKETKKSKYSQKETKSSSTTPNLNHKEKKKNSQRRNTKEENSMIQGKTIDHSTEDPTEMINLPGEERLNGSVALIIMPELVVNKEQKQGNPEKKEEKNSPRPISALSIASSSPSLNQELAYTELKEENEDQNFATYESTALFQTCIPYLPVEIAVVCLVFNILIPGLGSFLCGISNFCCGKMQETVKKEDVPMKMLINLLIGLMQLLTVTFLLVGWFWSMAWGIKILLLSIENQKRMKKEKLMKDKKLKAKFAFTYADDDDDDDQIRATLKY